MALQPEKIMLSVEIPSSVLNKQTIIHRRNREVFKSKGHEDEPTITSCCLQHFSAEKLSMFHHL